MSQETPPGWYPDNNISGQSRYWDGTQWTDHSAPAGTMPVATTSHLQSPPKKKRRVFIWVFLAIQVLFLVWVIAGASSAGGDATDCGTLDQESCNAAADIGTGIGVFIVIVLWCIVDFLLAVGYLIYRLAKRP